jgi:hypothetical protein
MRNPVIPVEPVATGLLECRHNLAKLGMDRAAVVALVVILNDDLPIGFYIVGDGMPYSEFREGVAPQSCGAIAQR